jgi:threonine/homoserine/homoserine lactone efflux protein
VFRWALPLPGRRGPPACWGGQDGGRTVCSAVASFAVVAGLLILGTTRLRAALRHLRLRRATVRRLLDAVTGVTLIGFGVELALSER